MVDSHSWLWHNFLAMPEIIRIGGTADHVVKLGPHRYRARITATEDLGARSGKFPFPPFKKIGLERYLKNPQVLYEHNSSEAPGTIANTRELRILDDGRVEADFEFLTGDDRAGRIENAWEKGFLRGASVRITPSPTDRRGWDLLEWSITPIPADADSVMELQRTILGEPGDNMDAAAVEKAISDAIKGALPKQEDLKSPAPLDVEGLTRSLSDVIGVEFKRRDDATAKTEAEAVAAKKITDEKESTLKRSMENAEDRLELLVSVKPLLPDDFVTRGITNKDIIVKALGDEVKDAEKLDEAYLRGVLDQIILRRSDLPQNKPAQSRASNGKDAPTGATGFPLTRPLSVVDIANLNKGA